MQTKGTQQIESDLNNRRHGAFAALRLKNKSKNMHLYVI